LKWNDIEMFLEQKSAD